MISKPIFTTHYRWRFLALLILAYVPMTQASGGEKKPYNVIFIAIDDLNDWISPLGGHPQAITPNFDRLAESSVTFTSAVCPSTVCGPSRSSILTGRFPGNTGVYGNNTNLKDAPATKDLETLPEYFGNRGYHTLVTGKIFHKHGTEDAVDQGHWAFKEVGVTEPKWGMAWEKQLEKDRTYRWGAWKVAKELTKDYMAAEWAAQQLKRNFKGEPFFLALGFSKPHLPFHAPEEFYDLYPLETIQPPSFKRDDYADILRPNGKPAFGRVPGGVAFDEIDEKQLHAEVTRAYLATVSYLDACLGVVLDALEKSPYRDNTILVVWSDHGWHLGEKLRYGKTWLWQEAARVPLFVRVPGLAPENVKSSGVVNLIDLYPTLVELCDLPKNESNDGRSFAELLKNPTKPWNTPTLTTYKKGNHSVYDGRYRYTVYRELGGSEELYDHQVDPMELTNLVSSPEHQEIVKRLAEYIPPTDAPESPINPYDKKIGENRKATNEYAKALMANKLVPRALMKELKQDGVAIGGDKGVEVVIQYSEDQENWKDIADLPQLRLIDEINQGRLYSYLIGEGQNRYFRLKPSQDD